MVLKTELWKPNVEDSPHGKKVKAIATSLYETFQIVEIAEKIKSCNLPGRRSHDIQNVIIEAALKLGFKDEKKGLFATYEVSGLRPDYFLDLNGEGIIFEVERGKTLINNMDILDLWKCHLCTHANFLFLAVPQILQQNESEVKSGKGAKVYETVCRRMRTFFKEGTYTNVNGLVIFGY